MNVICFGDSNTYGYDPRSWYGGRYKWDCRWVNLLSIVTGWRVCNEGENGREIPTSPVHFPTDTDLMIIMLGTNDLLQDSPPEESVVRLERFVSDLPIERSRILLIAPPPVTLGAWVPDTRLIDHSRTYAGLCRVLAEQIGVRFADAGEWNIPLAFDGVHFTEQGHYAFADGLLKMLRTR